MNYISEKKHKLIRELMTSCGLSNYASVSYNPIFKKYYVKMSDGRFLVLQKWIMDLGIKEMKEKQDE